MSFSGNTNGFVDTKKFRKCVLENSNERLGLIVKSLSNGENGTYVPKDRGLLGLLDSSYKSDVPSTNYAMHLKAIAFESARFLCTVKQVTDDIIFDTTRGEYLSQNIAVFLFPGQRFAHTNSTDEKVRNFYLSIIEAYFGGSTRDNIQRSLLSFLEVPVGIVENFLLTREDATLDEIINKFTFDIVIEVDDPRIKDVNQLQKDIEFLLNIIKPAHTTFTTKFIFSELFDIFRKGCILVTDEEGKTVVTHDGFETKIKRANTAICEVLHFDTHDYYYEDFRKRCLGENYLLVEDEIVQKIDENGDLWQAAPRLVKSIIGGTWDTSDPTIFHTRFGPFGKEDGSLATVTDDVQVYVNGVRAEVEEIYALSASFRLRTLPPEDATVTVSYYYLRKYVGALITNHFDSVLNNWKNQATELNYKSVLFPSGYSIEEQIPLEKSYRYKGFNLFNSSILNDAQTLNMNELSLRNRMNDYDIFKSHGYDEDIYATTLVDGQELFPRSLEKKDVWRRIPFQEFRMNNNEFVMNNREDRMYGELHYDSYHPFYSALEYDILDNGGEPDLVHTICEDARNGMMIDFRRLIEIDFTYNGTETVIKRDFDCQFFTYPLIPDLYSGTGFVPATFTVLNDLNCTLQGGNGSWDLAHPLPEVPDYHFGGTHTTMRMLIDDIKEEDYSSLDYLSSGYGLDELWEVLWNRDPSENPVYSTSSVAGEGNSADRGYLLHTFEEASGYIAYPNPASIYFDDQATYYDASGYVSVQPDPVMPMHLDDVAREYYKEDTWLIANSGQTNNLANILSGTKLKDSDVNTSYVSLTEYVPFIMNSFRSVDLVGMDPSVNSYGIKVTSINQNPPYSSPLLFLTPRKILNGEVTSVYNETRDFFYDLTGMNIINNQVIDLDESFNPEGLNNGDDVRVDYVAVDYTNEYDQLISVNDPTNFVLFTHIETINVYKIVNYTKGFEYDLSGNAYLEGNTLIHLDPSAGINSTIGLDQGDIIFATFIAENESQNAAPRLTRSNDNFATTLIEVAPENPYDDYEPISVRDSSNYVLFSSNDISILNNLWNFTRGIEYNLGGSFHIDQDQVIHLDSTLNNSIGLDQEDIIFGKFH